MPDDLVPSLLARQILGVSWRTLVRRFPAGGPVFEIEGQPVMAWRGRRRYFRRSLLKHLPIYTVGRAARMIGVHPETGRRGAKSGRLPTVSIGPHKRRRVTLETIRKLRATLPRRTLARRPRIR